MPPAAHLVRTPTDFRRAMADTYTVTLFTPGDPHPALEPFVRHAMDAIFDDLQDIDQHDRGMVSAYLDGIQAPLAELDAMGLAVFALLSPARLDGMEVTHGRYLVIPRDGRFQAGEGTAGPVHRFDPRCEAAVADLARGLIGKAGVMLCANKAGAEMAYERRVPWCLDCCLDDATE